MLVYHRVTYGCNHGDNPNRLEQSSVLLLVYYISGTAPPSSNPKSIRQNDPYHYYVLYDLDVFHESKQGDLYQFGRIPMYD